MISIMFVCHGNICRSPMAEFIMKDMVKKKGIANKFNISSKGISNEEEGNGIHRGTKDILIKNNIPYNIDKRSSKLDINDYYKYDYFIVMDSYNLRGINYIFNDIDNKVYKLLDFANINRDIDDPWYTGDFESTYKDVSLGCSKLLEYLIRKCNLI